VEVLLGRLDPISYREIGEDVVESDIDEPGQPVDRQIRGLSAWVLGAAAT
jgi:hypothetical protein